MKTTSMRNEGDGCIAFHFIPSSLAPKNQQLFQQHAAVRGRQPTTKRIRDRTKQQHHKSILWQASNQEKNYSQETNIKHPFLSPHAQGRTRMVASGNNAKKRHIRPTSSDPPFYHSAFHQAKLFQHHAWPFAAAFFDGVLDGRCGGVKRRILHRESRTRTYDRYYHKSQASSVESNKLRH